MAAMSESLHVGAVSHAAQRKSNPTPKVNSDNGNRRAGPSQASARTQDTVLLGACRHVIQSKIKGQVKRRRYHTKFRLSPAWKDVLDEDQGEEEQEDSRQQEPEEAAEPAAPGNVPVCISIDLDIAI
jgi:hypothetical protein